jgi:hypothetical protein
MSYLKLASEVLKEVLDYLSNVPADITLLLLEKPYEVGAIIFGSRYPH